MHEANSPGKVKEGKGNMSHTGPTCQALEKQCWRQEMDLSPAASVLAKATKSNRHMFLNL